MKFLSILLAFVVLVLSVQPACASEAGGDACCAADSRCTKQECDDDHQQRDCSNGCNPFQVCACCCAAVVVPGLVFVFSQPVSQPAIVSWGVFIPQSPVWPAYGVWQPPKIAVA